MAQTQELRAAIKRFRAGGKFVYAFADDYGDGAAGNGQYSGIGGTTRSWVQPMGQAMLADVMFEAPFLKEALRQDRCRAGILQARRIQDRTRSLYRKGLYRAGAKDDGGNLANDLTLQLVTDIAAQPQTLRPTMCGRCWRAAR